MALLGQLPEPQAKPVFIVVSGLPGTGKSYFSKRLAGKLPVVILESDALRKALFDPPNYSQEESAYLFRACNKLIANLLERGVSVVLDATNLFERFRERLYRIADSLEAKLILVRIEASPEVVKNRLESRAGSMAGNSDADWSVYQKMKDMAERMTRNHYVVDTSKDIKPAIDKIAKEFYR